MDGVIDFLHNLLPASWFESAQERFGQGLTDDVVAQSVHEASVFFGMDDPINVHEDWTTGVMTNMSWTDNDDVLIFSRDQMREMGITDKEGFDLVMTHEGAHRMLQKMHQQTEFNSHQEELCCDYMAGVRAGLNGMDITKMEISLVDTPESDTHPAGSTRVVAMEAGADFAHEFMDKYHEAPTFTDCLEYFEQTDVYAQANVKGKINLFSENTHAYNDDNADALEKAHKEHHLAELAAERGDYAEMREHERLAKAYETITNDTSYDDSLHSWVNDREWNLKQAANEQKQADYYSKEAEMATKKGDYQRASDLQWKANQHIKKMNDYVWAANHSKK